MIADDIVTTFGARLRHLDRNEVLFAQGDTASHFYIVRTGKIKMMTHTEEGREFVQGYFTDGQSFGEPPFFLNEPYPASAVAMIAGEVWACPRDGFLTLLRENPGIHLAVTQGLSSRLLYKSMMLTEIAVEEAEHRLTTLIEYLRRAESGTGTKRSFRVPLTRQLLADMTGLRVETVIRSIKAMEQRRLLSIDTDGKIVWRHAQTQQKEAGP
ncbi:MAG: Crp/Fnr family transcriptional regulator [Ignavibacteriae bacterium]|nr:Crp/Fnr family transcriptional regulator [Ignavibacteriota bacterium]